MTDLVLGVDIGSSSAKAVLVDPSGQVQHRTQVPTGMTSPQPGWFEQNADTVWWNSFVELVRLLLQQSDVDAKQIRAVGVSGIGPCVLPLDESGRPLRSGILYGIDSRALDQCQSLESLVESRGGHGLFTSQSAIPKMMWIQEHEPDVWANTSRIVDAAGYLIFKLCGEHVLSHYDASAYGPHYSPDRHAWDSDFDDVVSSQLLARLVWSDEIVGKVSEHAAGLTGLKPGTPIVAGTADAAAEATSAGFSGPGDLMIMLGTSGYFLLHTESASHSDVFWPTPGPTPESHLLTGGMNSVGSLVQWLQRTMCEPDASDADVVALAEQSPPGARGLITLPYLAGERTPIHDPHATGALIGLRLDHTRSDIVRAFHEAIALGIADNISRMCSEGHAVRRVVAAGGGAFNTVLLQAIADCLALPVHVPADNTGAALGDALRAATGIGWFPSLSAAADSVQFATIIEPRPQLTELYQERLATYRELYRSLQAMGSDLLDK